MSSKGRSTRPISELLVVLVTAATLAACGSDDGGGGGQSDETAEAARPETPFRLRNLAKLHADRDSDEGFAEAAALLERLVALEPDDFEAWLALGQTLHFAGLGDEATGKALARARELAESDDQKARLHYAMGLWSKKANDHLAAAASFAAVLKLLPDHPQALYQHGFASERAKRYDEAERSYQALVDSDRLVRPAAYRLSRIYARTKQDAKREAITRIYSARPSDEKPATEKCPLAVPDRRLIRRAPRAARAEEPPIAFAVTETGKTARRALPLPGGDLLLINADHVGFLRSESTATFEGIDAADGVVADLDNDGELEAVVFGKGGAVLIPLRKGERKARPLIEEGLIEAIAFDADHDGDLDLVAVTVEGMPVLYRHDGKLRLERSTPFGGALSANPTSLRMDAHDLDEANDIDFVFPDTGGPRILMNRRAAGFEVRRSAFPDKDCRAVILEDFDGDGTPDVFICGSPFGWALDGREFQAPPDAGVRNHADATAGDFDNDGDLDILLDGALLLQNIDGRLVERDGVDLQGAFCTSSECTDLDGDGRLEIVIVDQNHRVLTATASNARTGHMVVRPAGKRDNARAVGTVVEVYEDGHFQSRMIKDAHGAHFGLAGDDRRDVDGIYLRWPQGIRQSVVVDELEVDAGGVASMNQKEGLVASCPFLYVLGPDGWRFHTDVVGIAPLDEWLPPGATPHKDPEEWVRIAPGALAVKDGVATVAITEELRETTYLDRVELHWIDHDPKQVLLGEETSAQGAYDPLAVWVVDADDLVAASSVSAGGRDGTSATTARDGRWFHGYPEERGQWAGWTRPWSLETSCAEAARLLVLEGRLAWYDSTVAYAVSQSGRGWMAPTLLRLLPDGGTRTLLANTGVPNGMDRTVVLDLGETHAAGSSFALRSQYRLLFDRVRFARAAHKVTFDGSASPLPRGHAAPSAARLFWRGYSRVDGDAARHEQTYVYDDAGPRDDWASPTGRATRHGDVRELLTRHDDRLCVLAPGDAVEIAFAVPPPSSGRTRTFFLRISGWCKEASWHNPTGRSITPLPFRAMSSYPPDPHDATPSPGRTAWLEEYQTRTIMR